MGRTGHDGCPIMGKQRLILLLLVLSEAQVEGGDDEQVEHGRGDQATQDDDGHRVLDLVAGDIAGDHQGHQGQSRRQGGHQDWREPIPRSPQDEPGTERLAFFPLEVLIVIDQHDAVARGYPKDREEAHQRTERNHAAGRERRQHPAHQG